VVDAKSNKMVATPNSSFSSPSPDTNQDLAVAAAASKYPELAGETLTTRRPGSNGSGHFRARPKALRMVGDLRLASTRARRRLGSEMSIDQRRSQRRNDDAEACRRRSETQRKLLIALAKLPSDNQLGLPHNMTGQVPLKALSLLGDNLLEELSRRQIPPGARVTPKVLKFFGSDEPSLIPAKARYLMIGQESIPSNFEASKRLSHLNGFAAAWGAVTNLPSSDCRLPLVAA